MQRPHAIDVDLAIDGSTARIVLSGQLDRTTVTGFLMQTEAVSLDGHLESVVFHLGDLTSIDIDGLRALMAAGRTLGEVGRPVHLASSRGGAPVQLAETFEHIARSFARTEGLLPTLEQIVGEAIDLVDPCDHAAVDIVANGRVTALAPSSEQAARIGQIQDEVDDGPCRQALRDHEIYWTHDLTLEERWPAFSRRARAETDIRSIVGYRLYIEGETLGALNLYSTRPHAFDEDTRTVASVLAAHAAMALYSARTQEQLEAALRTRDLIGQAKGMVMERAKVDAEEAFGLLRQASQLLNMKLRDVAAGIVANADAPAPGDSVTG